MVSGAAAHLVIIYISNSLPWPLPHGSVVYIQSDNRLLVMPLPVLEMAFSTAAMPSLAALRELGRIGELKEAQAHRRTLFAATPP